MGNLLLEIQTPEKPIVNMINWGAGVGGINNLIHWSEGDLSTRILPFMSNA